MYAAPGCFLLVTTLADVSCCCPTPVCATSQVWVGAVGVGPAPHRQMLEGVYKNHDSAGYQDSMGESLALVCNIVPHGVLCFFPSYSLLEKLLQRWRVTGMLARIATLKDVVVEPRQGGDGLFEAAMTSFYAAVRRSKANEAEGGRGGGLFLAVCRGKVRFGFLSLYLFDSLSVPPVLSFLVSLGAVSLSSLLTVLSPASESLSIDVLASAR